MITNYRASINGKVITEASSIYMAIRNLVAGAPELVRMDLENMCSAVVPKTMINQATSRIAEQNGIDLLQALKPEGMSTEVKTLIQIITATGLADYIEARWSLAEFKNNTCYTIEHNDNVLKVEEVKQADDITDLDIEQVDELEQRVREIVKEMLPNSDWNVTLHMRGNHAELEIEKDVILA